MQFSSRVFALIGVAGGLATVVESSMSMRGNTKPANKLLTFARRLEDGANYNNNGANNANGGYNQNYNGANANNGGQNGQYSQYGQNYGQGGQGGQYGGSYGDMDEESMYFLTNYSIKLLSCIQGEQVINYENGEIESSTVVFRLCPVSTCDMNAKLGCDSGYGDYAVGINTFLEAYMESQQDDQYYYGNGMVTYNQYGQEFDAEEYMECKEYDGQDDGQNNQQQNYYNNQYNNQNNNGQYNNNQNQNQYNNGQNGNYYQDVQVFIGPGCSSDGTSIALGMYMDEYCSYPASLSFSDIASGWETGLPFSDGGLVSMNCVACYGPDQDYNYELSELCMGSYEASTSRCESQMESYSYYGQKNNGCDYVEALIETVYSYSSTNDATSSSTGTTTDYDDTSISGAVNELSTRFMDTLSTREARAFIAAMVLFALSACFGATLIGYCCVRAKRRKAKLLVYKRGTKRLIDDEDTRSRHRPSVVALVRSGTNNIAESVRSRKNSMAQSVKSVAASIRRKSSFKQQQPVEVEVVAETTPDVVYVDMKDTAATTTTGAAATKSKEEDSAAAVKGATKKYTAAEI